MSALEKPQWIKMNREQAGRVLTALSGREDAIVFSRDMTEVAWRTLPFYRNFRLYRLTNYATMPVFSMSYLGDGADFTALDGTATPIYAINKKDPLMLKQGDVIAYLQFFFANVQGSEGDALLVPSPDKMPFMSSLAPALQQSIRESHRPLSVAFDGTLNAYVVSGTMHYGGSLLAARIAVLPDGKLSFREQTPLLSGVHLPHYPHGAAWLDGDSA